MPNKMNNLFVRWRDDIYGSLQLAMHFFLTRVPTAAQMNCIDYKKFYLILDCCYTFYE